MRTGWRARWQPNSPAVFYRCWVAFPSCPHCYAAFPRATVVDGSSMGSFSTSVAPRCSSMRPHADSRSLTMARWICAWIRIAVRSSCRRRKCWRASRSKIWPAFSRCTVRRSRPRRLLAPS
uniref:Putative secreted protein n=1 Tax=Anopheles triannulatus TaxID=58253 RepID=A0A2M4B4I6_9DIPT